MSLIPNSIAIVMRDDDGRWAIVAYGPRPRDQRKQAASGRMKTDATELDVAKHEAEGLLQDLGWTIERGKGTPLQAARNGT